MFIYILIQIYLIGAKESHREKAREREKEQETVCVTTHKHWCVPACVQKVLRNFKVGEV